MTQQSGNTYLPIYDGNGNVHGLINASSGSLDAAYEYDAFGNTLRESGTFAASNNFRFSTKYADLETSLIYYGTRFYSPSQGRFINRDSIEEQGGLNLYAFCSNNGVNSYDVLGREDGLWGPDPNGGINWVSLDGMDGLDRMNANHSSVAEGVEHDPNNTDGGGMERWGDWNRVSGLQALGIDARLSENNVLSVTLTRNLATDLTTALSHDSGFTNTYLANDYRALPVGHVTIGPFMSALAPDRAATAGFAGDLKPIRTVEIPGQGTLIILGYTGGASSGGSIARLDFDFTNSGKKGDFGILQTVTKDTFLSRATPYADPVGGPRYYDDAMTTVSRPDPSMTVYDMSSGTARAMPGSQTLPSNANGIIRYNDTPRNPFPLTPLYGELNFQTVVVRRSNDAPVVTVTWGYSNQKTGFALQPIVITPGPAPKKP